MDDVNINNIYLGIEEMELDGEEKEWVKLSWIYCRSDDDGNSQSSEVPRMNDNTDDSDNEMADMKDCDTVLFTSAESEDISDGISVITESDTDAVNTSLFQVCQLEPPQMLEVQMSGQKDIWNILIACVLGIIIGLTLSNFFTIPESRPVSSGVDAESLRIASHDIVNTCKELADVKAMLNEIKAHIPADRKIREKFLAKFSEITDSSDKTSSEPIVITKEFFNSTSHSLDQLQGSLHVLLSLTFIRDNNSSLKHKITKTLDIVNNTKVFYDTLTLLTNSTQDEFNALNFLQHDNDKMYNTSKLLLSNLEEKVSKATAKVYNKYAKERHRLNKKLCHLKSTLPDDKLLKQLTESNELFKDYDKSCFLNYTSKTVDDKARKGNTKIKEQIIKTDTVSHPKYDKRNNHKIHGDDKEDSLKNEKNEKQNVDKSTAKFLRNSRKIRDSSELFVSEIVENIGNFKHQLSKTLNHLTNILHNDERFKQLIHGVKRDNKESVKYRKGKDSSLLSNIMSKNSFDDILMQLKNTFLLSTDYSKFNINTSTFDLTKEKTKNDKESQKEHTNSKKTVDHENSAKVLSAEKERRPREKDYFKSNGSTEKIVNYKANYEGKNISFQNKINNHVLDIADNYHKSKHSSPDGCTTKQDNQHYTNTDRGSDRSYEYKKQWHLDDSDWYFRRAHSRRNARRHAERLYQQVTRLFGKIVDEL
ncbi:PREDICTED: uncharacterized protein LOC105562544 isoform X2 [Vollenhovia emeryi]|nr:PREDICTED: uncharacterized protein LOC105562544 isoform X2 [Vollenhovia emeryi]XP_011868869.1 PREDICTED: uncharacterized protein LOC105562544 isoform X2 [Vollenhovia emeryi]